MGYPDDGIGLGGVAGIGGGSVDKVTFEIEVIEHEGQEVPCLVRNGRQYIDLESINLFFELAERSSDAYESICQTVDTWLDTMNPVGLDA